MIEEIRAVFTGFLFYILPEKTRQMLSHVRKDGFFILKSYYSPVQVRSIRDEIERIKPLALNDPSVMKMPGSIRLKRLENHSLFIRSLAREPYWFFLNAIYTLRFNFAVTMLSITDLQNLETNDDQKDEEEFYAQQPHFDSYLRELKVVIALSKVGEKSGPTEIAVGSSKYYFKFWRDYFSSWLARKGIVPDKTLTMDDHFANIIEKNGNKKFILEEGDIVIFDTRNIHRATPLSEGNRELLWLYY